jgi:hypothetical protein
MVSTQHFVGCIEIHPDNKSLIAQYAATQFCVSLELTRQRDDRCIEVTLVNSVRILRRHRFLVPWDAKTRSGRKNEKVLSIN